jgi:hypothetical protein
MAKNDLINNDLVKHAQQKTDKALKQVGLIKEETLTDKVGEGFGKAGKAVVDTLNAAVNGAQLLPEALSAAANSRNRDAWVKPPTPEQSDAYKANKDNTEYQKIVAALENLNRLMTTGNQIPEGAGVHHIAGVLYKHSNLQGGGALLAGGSEVIADIGQSASETVARVAGAFNSSDDWSRKIGAVGGAVVESAVKGLEGIVSFFGGDGVNSLKKDVLDKRIALIKEDLAKQGFEAGFIDLVAEGARQTAIKEAGIDVSKIPPLASVKLDTNQSNVPTETPTMFISGNSKGVGK